MTRSPKFSATDRDFIARRTKFFAESKELTPVFAVDNWPLLVGAVPIAQLLAYYETLKMTVGIPGHLLEFGVANGSSLMLAAKIMSILASNDLKILFGFDSWMGLSEFSDQDAAAIDEKGRYVGDRNLLVEMMNLHGLNDRVHLIDGVIEQTLPEFINQNPHHLFSLIHIDTDLYASTKVILERCWPRVPPGGVVVLDEGYHDRFPGEGTAMNEFLASVPGTYECGSFPFSRQPMLWIRKR